MARLSVVIVSYDSLGDIARCLASFDRQRNRPDEIIVVDNKPGDGVAEFLHRAHPHVRVIASPENVGFAEGNNLGIRAARGERVLLLNPDTELHEGALDLLMAAAEQYPNALLTPKLLNPDGTVNACGLEMHVTGVSSCRCFGWAADSISGTHLVPLASGAALAARKSVLEESGLFDERYFMYMEDVDLSLRARAHGYEIRCVADAVVTHHYRLAMTPQKFYLLERNRLLTLYKLLSPIMLRQIAPALALTSAATWAYALLHGTKYLRARLAVALWLRRYRRDVYWMERYNDPGGRDAVMLLGATEHLPFAQLVSNVRLAKLLTNVTTPLFRVAAARSRIRST